MKRYYILTVLLLQVLFAFAQSNYKEGYVITNNNDTLRGWIDYRTDKMNAQICNFKRNIEDKEPTAYKPGDIIGFRFSQEGKFYVTRSIEIEKRQPQTVFLEYLVQGLMNLYFYTDENDLSYYIFEDRDTGKMTYTTKKPDEITTTENGQYNKPDNRYRSILAYTFKDYESIKKEAQKLDFKHSSMIDLAKDYHKLVCTTDEECIEFETKEDKKKTKVRFLVSGGMEYQSTKNEHLDIKFDPYFAPFIKAGIDFSVPRWQKSLSLVFNLYLTKTELRYKGDPEKDIYVSETPRTGNYYNCLFMDYTLNAYQIGTELYLKYTYPKGKFRPNCQMGINIYGRNFNEKLYSYEEYAREILNKNSKINIRTNREDWGNHGYDRFLFNNLNFGVGIDFLVWKEQCVSLNFGYKAPIISSAFFTKTQYLQIELGYKF
ncbi:MAG: hypothetical protein LBN27_13530 [Prevotellaceae bacterium]|jgi:hypothetical protein|nr:hypothetical protein [Prevotellaceae bacterium]